MVGSPLVRLARPGNTLVAAAAVWAGSFLAGQPLVPSRAVLLGMVSAVAFAAAGNVRNDLSDVELDKRAHPNRPLAAGLVSRPAARFFAFVLYAVAVEAAAIISLVALILVLAAIPLMEMYERKFKQQGIPGNLVIALLTAAPFILGGVAASRTTWSSLDVSGLAHPALLVVALLAALATAGREIVKDIEDVESDRNHRVTLPMRVGNTGAAALAAAFFVAAVLLSPLPFLLENVIAWPYVPAVGVADACFLAAAATGAKRPAWSQRLAKAGMVLAIVALVVGRAFGSEPF